MPLSHLWRAPADAVEERVEGFGSRRRHENDLLHQQKRSLSSSTTRSRSSCSCPGTITNAFGVERFAS